MNSLKKHIKEVAEESGVDIEECSSNIKKEIINGLEVESWYDENASSSFSAWNAFIKGFGTFSRPSREEAIKDALAAAGIKIV